MISSFQTLMFSCFLSKPYSSRTASQSSYEEIHIFKAFKTKNMKTNRRNHGKRVLNLLITLKT